MVVTIGDLPPLLAQLKASGESQLKYTATNFDMKAHSFLPIMFIVSILQEAMNECPSPVFEITQGLVLKDAAYGVAAYVYYELSNYLSFKDWSWWPMSTRKPLYSSEFADASTDEIAAVLFTFIRDILKLEVLKEYIPKMDSMAREHVESNWAGKEVVKVLPASKKLAFDLACRFLMNVVDDEQITTLAKHFVPVAKAIYAVPLDLPGTAYNRAIKSGKLLREELIKIITEKRNAMLMENNNNEKSAIGQDLLSRLLLVTDENGEFLSAKQICNNIIGLLLAGYESTGTAITFVLKYLAELPHIYNEVYREQMEIANSKKENEWLKWEDVQKMKYSWNVVCEAQRLLLAGIGALREAVTDFNFAGFTIPKGMKAYWTTHITHKNPKYFPDPEKFDPSRFEGNRIAPYTFVPFGGGSRMCTRKEYAQLEILVFIHNIVTNFRCFLYVLIV